MTRFIWIRDRDKIDHYLNVNHIIRVTKVPAHGSIPATEHIILRDGKEIRLSTDKYDTAEDVIAKIQAAMA